MRPIFFCHIPKTAGTTLRKALEANFRASEIVPNRNAIHANGGLYPPVEHVYNMVINRRDEVKLLLGHYHYSFHKAINEPIKIIIFRNPFARSISLLKHRIARGGISKERIMNFLDRGKFPGPDNHMTRFIVGSLNLDDPSTLDEQHSRLMKRPLTDHDTVIREAEAVLKTVDLLGVTERFEELREPLAMCGITLPDRKLNQAEVDDLVLSDRQIDTIRSHNIIDEKIYQRVLSLIESRTDSNILKSNYMY